MGPRPFGLMVKAFYYSRQYIAIRHYVRVVFPPELSALQPFCILVISNYAA